MYIVDFETKAPEHLISLINVSSQLLILSPRPSLTLHTNSANLLVILPDIISTNVKNCDAKY